MEKLDVVACEVVAFCAVKFWSVVEPEAKYWLKTLAKEVLGSK